MVSRLADDIFNTLFKSETNNKINKLMKTPKKDKGYDIDYFSYDFPKDTFHNLDLLYLPKDDDGSKYCLVVVDVATRLTDARPLKTRNMAEVIEQLKDIYDGDILTTPKMIQADSEFDNVEFKKAFEHTRIKITRVGRHKSNGFAENRNHILGRVLHKRMNAEEVYLNEKQKNQHYSKNWVKYLPAIIKQINIHLERSPEKIDIKKIKPIRFNKKQNGEILTILRIGTKVRVILEEPKDTKNKKLHGKFRASDIRWDPTKIYTIEDILFRPNHPIRYILNDMKNTAFSKNELQVYNGKEQPINISTVEKYLVEKIIGKKKIKNKIFYLIKWLGYDKKDNTYENKDDLIKDGFEEEIKEFESNLKIKK